MKTLITVLLSAASLMILFGSPNPQTAVPDRTLTFAERVAYQTAIEDVYWRHRIWPKESPDPKPPLDAVMSQADLENKVTDYLRRSQAVADSGQRQITAEQLQAEMDRMAMYTNQPEVLDELFEALGNDPFVIAECLARPILAERLVTIFYGDHQERFDSWRATADSQLRNVTVAAGAGYTLPAISEGPNGCIEHMWTATSTTNAPTAREVHTAVWTGSEMIVWGGYNHPVGALNTGGRYNPSTDSWTRTSTLNAPTARGNHTAVWTGSEMIVWGGANETAFDTGGRYNPSTNSWTATSITNAPAARYNHTAVWTGSEMIVWAGSFYDGTYHFLNTGGRYNPSTNSWTATSTNNAPIARGDHTAVWTGSGMIVWGGWNGSTYVNNGGRYNPSTNSWTPTSTTNAPIARGDHTAVWTGSQMIVYGGSRNGGILDNTGGRYNPSTNSWTTTSTTNAPTMFPFHTAVWTGSQMIVWGGYTGSIDYNNSGRYDPSTNSWAPTNPANAPTPRTWHTAVWTGSQMIVWGGQRHSVSLNTGGRYCAAMGGPPWYRIGDPATYIASNSFRANWSSANGATGYRLDVSTDIWFSTYVPGYQNLNIGNATSRSVSGLNTSTTYYYRVRAYNGAGTGDNSNIVNVTTLSPTGPPVVITKPATNVASFSATLNSSVDPHGLTTTVYFQYGTTTSYGLTTAIQSKTGNTYQNVAANIGGLARHTTYHFRIVATNSVGTSYGSDRTFTTQ